MNKTTFEDLKDKTCVITGGAGVIGAAIAKGLGAVGVQTVIMDLNNEAAERVALEVTDETGTRSVGVEGNVLKKDSLIKAKEYILKEFNSIDFLINGAGGNSPKATTQVEEINKDDLGDLGKTFFGLEIEAFQKVFDLNFIGTLLPSMVFAEDMVKAQKGAILNISSMNSYRPLTKIPAYSAAKASVNNFTQWLAVHFAKSGIRVNAIAPGFFLTNQNRFLLLDEKTEELTPRGEKIIANTPMDRFGDPEDLQGTVLYLLSNVSAFVTGVIIPVDGGFNAFSGV